MRLNLSVDDALLTTRSVRKRLDFDRPVARETLMECLDLALQAPTGSNRQGWQWLFIEDPVKKRTLRDLYLENFEKYRAAPRPQYLADDPRADRIDKVLDSAAYLAEHMHRAPVLMIPCLEGRPNVAGGNGASFWGSILPAAWSFMLALRERGMGSAWTTIHLLDDGDRKAAELLGIPYERYSQAGLFPIAYTLGTDFKPASRLPASELTHWDQW